MKKRILFITIALLMLLSTAVFLTGCGNFRQPPISTPDARHAVFSNGGSAVQVGHYIYFVNGYGGFTDPDADANVWRQVEKGGLYRARLRGSIERRTFNFWYGTQELYVLETAKAAPDAPGAGFNIDPAFRTEFYTNPERVIEFQRDEDGHYLRDDYGYRIPQQEGPFGYNHIVSVERVIGKRIGQENTPMGGGIFILGEWIFFASPHNLRDHAGVVQSGRTDFFKASLDGSRMHLIYTTNTSGANAQYAFYSFGGNYYLVVLDGDEIVSVQMDRGGNRIRSSEVIARNVTSAYFPVRQIHYNGINEHGVENFIFWTRNAVAEDTITRGNILEFMRPNGNERGLIFNGGGTASIIGTDNGVFFYQALVYGINTVHYSNLHEIFMRRSDSYRAAWSFMYTQNDGNQLIRRPAYSHRFSNVAGNIRLSDFNQMHELIGIRPNHNNADGIYIIGFGGEGVMLFSKSAAPVRLHVDGSAQFAGYNGFSSFTHGVGVGDCNGRVWNTAYGGWTLFLMDGFDMIAVDLFGGENQRNLGTGFSGGSASFRLNILPSFAVFFANVPDVSPLASNYAWFVRLDDPYADPILVAYIIESERDTETPIVDDNGYDEE